MGRQNLQARLLSAGELRSVAAPRRPLVAAEQDGRQQRTESPGEGWAWGAAGTTRGFVCPRQLPVPSRHASWQPLSGGHIAIKQGRSSDALFWPRQFLNFHTKLKICSTVGWYFSPCRLWNIHREAIYQHCVRIQSPGPSASPPIIGHLHST